MKFSYPVILLAALSACSGQIQGEIFLDENGNNLKDGNEKAIVGVPFTVTLDNSTYKTGSTDDEGRYLVRMDGTNINGNYCIKVDALDLALINQSAKSKSLAMKELEASDSCPVDINGEPDCTNENCCGYAVCESASICQESDAGNNNEDNQCPTDDTGDPICTDSRCANQSACQTDSITIKSMEACGEPSGTSMTLDVPIAQDYSSRVGEISKTYPNTVHIGDTITVDIVYPSSCTFELYTLPSSFMPDGLSEAYNEITGELSLERIVQDNSSNLTKKDKPPLGHDKLYSYALSLKVVGSEGLAETEQIIQPSLICPDGNTVQASSTKVNIKGDQSLSLNAGISPDCPALGESATISADITNLLNSDISGAIYSVSISGGNDNLTITSLPSQCWNKGSGIECDIGTLSPGANETLSFEFKMTEAVSPDTSIRFYPEVEVDGTQYTDTVISCNY